MVMLQDFRCYNRIRRRGRMNKRHMKSTDKVEIAKQAIKEMMEEHQVSEQKPTAKHLLGQLLSQLDSLQEEDVEQLCTEVDTAEERQKEQCDSLQEDDFEKLCPGVDGTDEKPKEECDSLQEEEAVELDSLQEKDLEKLFPQVDGTEEKPPKQQLDSMQEEDVERSSPEVDKTEEIMKEVRNVKRQNLITHCLVTTMILLTVAWQISEVSLLLKVKKELRNPFNFIGGIIKGLILKGDRPEDDGEQPDAKEKSGSKPPLIKIPDLHLLDLPMFYSSDGE